MSNGLSDFNPSVGVASILSGDERSSYGDLDLQFLLHPTYKDIRPLKEIDAIKSSVRNLILTNCGDRPFQPQIGGNVIRYLFEPANRFVIKDIQDEIKGVIERHEPRVNAVAVSVNDIVDDNRLAVTIQFNIGAAFDQSAEINFYLERLR